jgi:hypothetical protein
MDNAELFNDFVESLNIEKKKKTKSNTYLEIVNKEKDMLLEQRKKGVSYEVMVKYLLKHHKIKITVSTLKQYLASPISLEKIKLENYDLQTRQNLFIEVSKSLHSDGVPTTKLFNILKEYCPPPKTEEIKPINNISSNPTELKTY